MTPTEIRATREGLGITQAQAAHLFHVSERTWRGWENDRSAIPPTAVLLLLGCRHVPRLLEWLKRQRQGHG